MKKTYLFAIMAVVLGFTACSKEEFEQTATIQKGMVLRATVKQPADTKATISDDWKFDFSTGDHISVTNASISTCYTFTKDGTDFKSEDAQPTAQATTWYAYFPSNQISLVGQSGTKADVPNKYALAGATASATTGEGGLSITMSPQVAILVIDNQKGSIDINVKNSATTWVSGLTDNENGFNVTDATSKQTLLSVSEKGTYYVAVPAGVQISVKDGGKTIKSTGTTGLTAGKYYELTIEAAVTTGYAEVKESAGIEDNQVQWIQLWDGGPKWAEININGDIYFPFNGSDIATENWGSNWRMPTKDDFVVLLDTCTCTWDNANNGLLVTGKGDYKDNSIFLPAAGCKYSESPNVTQHYYWASTQSDDGRVYCLDLCNANNMKVSLLGTYEFYSPVRAVLNEGN